VDLGGALKSKISIKRALILMDLALNLVVKLSTLRKQCGQPQLMLGVVSQRRVAHSAIMPQVATLISLQWDL
jgi:hypothetical protein